MTELEIAKLVLSNLPTVAIAVGVAKIYLRVIKFFESQQSQLNAHSERINQIVKLHLAKHPEDAAIFIKEVD